MDASEFLKDKSIAELKKVKTILDKKLKEKEDEGYVTLWVVSNEAINEACFEESDWEEAKKKLCEIIMRDSFKPQDVYYGDHPMINRNRVHPDEVSEWMQLNT